jgi:asparagine synthase (glutamine-hydrolysing)
VRRTLPAPVRRALFGGLSRLYPQSPRLPRPLRANATLRNLACDSAEGHGRTIATMQPEDTAALMRPEVAAAGHDPFAAVRTLYRRCNAPDHVMRCQYVDLFFGLADGMLTKVDRASMAHGLEVRSPMLDYRFIEHVWRVPRAMLIQGTQGKYILRKVIEQKIGEEAAWRDKRGFDAPVDAWFRGPLRERFRETVLSPRAATADWLRVDAIRALCEAHQSGRVRHGPNLWKLLMLETWLRRSAETRARATPCKSPDDARVLAPA